MKQHISEQEFESLLSLSGAKRYSYFVKRVVDWEEIWSLCNQDGWVLGAGSDGRKVVPVWPHKCFAEVCVKGEWENTKPAVIELDVWKKRWVVGMIKDQHQVAVFPTPQNKGVVVDPGQLNSSLDTESEQYE